MMMPCDAEAIVAHLALLAVAGKSGAQTWTEVQELLYAIRKYTSIRWPIGSPMRTKLEGLMEEMRTNLQDWSRWDVRPLDT